MPRHSEPLSPQHGFWQNAEPVNADYNADLKLPQLKVKQIVLWWPLVPHVFAEQENDAYFVQGLPPAYEVPPLAMELPNLRRRGRASEIIGEKALEARPRNSDWEWYTPPRSPSTIGTPRWSKLYDAYTEGWMRTSKRTKFIYRSIQTDRL